MAQRSANLDHRVADLMRPNPDHPLDPGAVEAVLHGLREQLDLDVVFVAEFAEGRRVFRFVDRHPDAPPVQDGTWHDLEASFCLRVVDGRLPEYIPDVGALGPEVDLPPVPFPIGTHLGTPVVLHDGSTYGTLCCFSLAAKPLMSDADLRLLRHCARLVARKIDRRARARPGRSHADPDRRLRRALRIEGLAAARCLATGRRNATRLAQFLTHLPGMSCALLIIDVQRALCEGDDAAHDVAGVIDRINAVARAARAAGHPVVLIQHETADGPFRHGSEGWQLAAQLETAPTDLRVRKRATDSFHQTDLQALLQAHAVTDLVICGLQSEYCVDTTTRRALALGYPVVLVADGHATCDSPVLSAALIAQHHNHTLASIASFGPRARPVAAHAVRFSPR